MVSKILLIQREVTNGLFKQEFDQKTRLGIGFKIFISILIMCWRQRLGGYQW